MTDNPNNGTAVTPISRAHPGSQNLKRGNSIGVGRKPDTYKLWLRSLLESPTHRAEFTRLLQDGDHKAFMQATQHAADHAMGKPVQKVETEIALKLIRVDV